MLLLAVTALEKMETLPREVWLKLGIGVAVLVVGVFVLRRILKMNKLIATAIIFIAMTVVFFSWVYNRTEPKFLTPFVERIAPFFPNANSYKVKQGDKAKP